MTVRVPINEALRLKSREPSITGNLPPVSSCTILFAVEPTSMLRVPADVIVPASKPVPDTTFVTEPVAAEVGCHCEPFHAKTWLADGAADVTNRVPMNEAFTF